MAVDIGSTTIAGHLASLLDGTVLASAGVMNPQIRFGEDLMSRVSYAMLHPDGAAEMTARRARGAAATDRGASRRRPAWTRDEILEIVLVGNPIMHHLVLGLDPTPLGQAPFTLATERAVHATAAELELGVAPRRPRLRAAVHRRARGRGHRRRDPLRAAAPRRARSR